MHSGSNSNRIRKIRFYPECFLFMLDVWLKRMSQDGYHLVDHGIITYIFEKGIPENREYFTYSSDRTGEGKYSISLRYPDLKKTYGKNRKKSKLNKANNSKGNIVLEIDTDRISLADNIGYKELVHDRNRLYFFRTVRNIVVIMLMLLVFIIVQCLKNPN